MQKQAQTTILMVFWPVKVQTSIREGGNAKGHIEALIGRKTVGFIIERQAIDSISPRFFCSVIYKMSGARKRSQKLRWKLANFNSW